jgi:hypothetical protein
MKSGRLRTGNVSIPGDRSAIDVATITERA